MLKEIRHDLKTGHKAVTIRDPTMAETIGQVPKDKIDEVLAGDLEDRCIIQKTRMTRHMSRLLQYEQFNDIMVKQPIKFLQIMTRNHDSPKISENLQKKEKKSLLRKARKQW